MSDKITNPQPDGEVGASTGEGTLRYWRAREAVRQGELALAAQDRSFAGMQARASAILGWSAAGMVALGAWSTQGHNDAWLFPAAAALFLSASCCVAGLWPRNWYSAGYTFSQLAEGHDTELQSLEAIAMGYETDCTLNRRALRQFARYLRAAWLILLAAGPIALLPSIVTSCQAAAHRLLGWGA